MKKAPRNRGFFYTKNNLMEAMRSTKAKIHFTFAFEAIAAPQRAPKKPPTKEAASQYKIWDWSNGIQVFKPANPETEFTKINKAETAAASFKEAHRNKSTKGLKIIPPPIWIPNL